MGVDHAPQQPAACSQCSGRFFESHQVATTNTRRAAEEVHDRDAVTKADYLARRVGAGVASDAAKEVTGQVFSVRKNEIFLMSQSRPLRGVHRSEGWTPQNCAEHMLPALKSWFFPLDRTADVFSWDSI